MAHNRGVSRSGYRLDLLRAPAGIRLAHVGRGLDGRDELEDDVGDADSSDDDADDVGEPVTSTKGGDGANKDVDYLK